MRTASAAQIAARQAQNLVTRELVQFNGRNTSTGAIETVNFWNDIVTTSLPVIDGVTAAVTNYSFVGAGNLIGIKGLEFVSEQQITVRNLTITANNLTPEILNLVSGYDLHEQLFQYWQMDFDPESMVPVDSAQCFFLGFVDTVDVEDASEGSAGSISISVRSYNSELTRPNTLYRTHASEVTRDPSDMFYLDAQNVGDWEIMWGVKKAKVLEAVNTIAGGIGRPYSSVQVNKQ